MSHSLWPLVPLYKNDLNELFVVKYPDFTFVKRELWYWVGPQYELRSIIKVLGEKNCFGSVYPHQFVPCLLISASWNRCQIQLC